MNRLNDIRLVLVETSHPGNIGAAARAMKTMGLERLYLVRPARFPHAEARARASGAVGVLADAVVCDSLAEALQGCTLVIGASARERTLPWPTLDPRQCAAQLSKEGGEAALVFGRERTGLINDEIEQCHHLVQIPANPAYSSLNLAAAAQVLCYELRMAVAAPPSSSVEKMPDGPLATSGEVEHFYAHLERTLIELEFLNPSNPRQLMRRLRRLFNRVRLSCNEVNILRGILTAANRQKPRSD